VKPISVAKGNHSDQARLDVGYLVGDGFKLVLGGTLSESKPSTWGAWRQLCMRILSYLTGSLLDMFDAPYPPYDPTDLSG
jgi:hypothetical protein